MESQSKRILALDLIKGGSVIGMVIIHTLLIYGDVEAQSESILGTFIRFLGRGPAIFLICMGITFMTSRHQSLKSSLQRGALLLLAALMMNFIKFMIPVFFDFVPDNYMQKFGWEAPLALQYVYLVQLGDILQLAGMSLLIVGFVRKYIQNKWAILGLALLVAAVALELKGINWDVVGINYLLDLTFNNDYPAYVYFPVFPWISFILIGMFFGKWYIELDFNEHLLFKKVPLVGLAMIAMGFPLVYFYKEYHFGDFYQMGPGGVIYFAGCTLLILWSVHIVSFKVNTGRLVDILAYCSKNLTTMYIIQWSLISWGKGLFGFRSSSLGEVLLLIPLFMALTFGVQKLVDIIKSNGQKKKNKETAIAA